MVQLVTRDVELHAAGREPLGRLLVAEACRNFCEISGQTNPCTTIGSLQPPRLACSLPLLCANRCAMTCSAEAKAFENPAVALQLCLRYSPIEEDAAVFRPCGERSVSACELEAAHKVIKGCSMKSVLLSVGSVPSRLCSEHFDLKFAPASSQLHSLTPQVLP